jgi:hypothetical protein
LLIAASIFMSPLVTAATFTTAGQNVAVEYNGIVEGDTIGGLSASTLYILDSISGDGRTWTFSGTLSNIGSVDSTISLAGFDSSADIDSGSSYASGAFSRISSGNVPQGLDLDFCLKNTRGKNCAGGGGTGATNGQTLEFMFAIQLMDGADELELSGFAARYQSIVGISLGQSGVGVAISEEFFDGLDVPLPASAWLLLSALGGLAAAKRKH